MRKDDYWNLFWATGLPEAWMMSRPDKGDLNFADTTAKAVPRRGSDLPDEVQQLVQNRAEASQDLTAR